MRPPDGSVVFLRPAVLDDRRMSSRLLRHPTVECLIMRPSRRNARAIAAYQKAGFASYDPALHQLPESVLSTGLDYADAVVLVFQRRLARNGFETDLAPR